MRLLGAVLQTLGYECIVLGFISYLSELWAEHDVVGDKVVPPHLFVALADLTRTLTHASPLIALTTLGALLIALGVLLRRVGPGGRDKVT